MNASQIIVAAVGRRLDELNMTAREAARLARVDESGLTRWLNGERPNPRSATTDAVLEALGLEVRVVALPSKRPEAPKAGTKGRRRGAGSTSHGGAKHGGGR